MDFWLLLNVLGAGEEKPAAPGGDLLMFAPLALIAIVFYFLLLRPQRKEQASRDAMLSALKKNDKVVTIGGIVGSVANISADGLEVTLKVDDNTRIKFVRSSIQKVLTSDGEPEKPADSK